MNEFTCQCGGKFKKNDELAYLSYPPKYLFKCDKCGETKVLSEEEALHQEEIVEVLSLLKKILRRETE